MSGKIRPINTQSDLDPSTYESIHHVQQQAPASITQPHNPMPSVLESTNAPSDREPSHSASEPIDAPNDREPSHYASEPTDSPRNKRPSPSVPKSRAASRDKKPPPPTNPPPQAQQQKTHPSTQLPLIKHPTKRPKQTLLSKTVRFPPHILSQLKSLSEHFGCDQTSIIKQAIISMHQETFSNS